MERFQMGTNFVGDDGVDGNVLVVGLVGVASLVELVAILASVGVVCVEDPAFDGTDLAGDFVATVPPLSPETESGERDDTEEGGDGEGVYPLLAGRAPVENRGGLARPRLMISDELLLTGSLS